MVNKLLMTTHIINFKHLEYRDFWEEVKQPLFVTEDGVEVFEVSTQKMFVVRLSDCEKFIFDTSVWSNISNGSKIYYHEPNADEYIWRNKRVFSYEDFIKWGNVPYQRIIEQLAKKGARNE